MTLLDRGLRGLSLLAGALLVLLSVRVFSDHTMARITVSALSVCLVLLTCALIESLRRPDHPFLLIAAMLCTLVIGRLFSTLHLVPPDASLITADPLSIAETGPGVPSVTAVSVALFLMLTARLLRLAQHDSRAPSGRSAEQWGLTALRIYVGMMFVPHFAGHLFGGPMAFQVFVTYFGAIGLPQPAAFVVLAGLIELAVTLGLAFGLMTRLAAVGAAVYLLVSVGLGGHFSVGYIWVLPTGGWEFPALWAFAVSVFAFTGGGPVSVDATLRQQSSKLRHLLV